MSGPDCYLRRRRPASAIATVFVAVLGISYPPVAHAAAVNATWTVTSLWNTGFVANYKITNSAATQLTDWTVEFDLPADESVTTVWGGELDQSGKHYVLTPEDYNHTVAPGGSISVGFQAALTGAYTAPVNCVINGEPCSDGSVPQGESATPAATVTASSGTQICDQFGTTTVAGSYVVQNNRWGSNAAQCIDVAGSGFSIAKQDGSVATDGAPLSYPSIYLGCHDNNCSPGSSLPTQLNQIRAANSSISYGYTDGTYDAAYDIWLDPTPKKDGVNQMEIMIWFNRQGPIQPVGSKTGSATISGRDWDVWQGNNGANKVISYVAPTPMDSWDFSVLDFTNDVRTKGLITDAWYLTSIQAGFEPWRGGVGLAVNSFSANVTH